eukprot:5404845-Pleurochrysis_carterae.AAC.11
MPSDTSRLDVCTVWTGCTLTRENGKKLTGLHTAKCVLERRSAGDCVTRWPSGFQCPEPVPAQAAASLCIIDHIQNIPATLYACGLRALLMLASAYAAAIPLRK